MFLISIGNDRKIFEEGSSVRNRQVEYGNLFDATHMIIWNEVSRGALGNTSIASNVFVYPTNSKNKLFYILDTLKIVASILKKADSKRRDFIVTTQDPFESGLVGVICKILFGIHLHVQLHTDFANKYFLKHSFLNKIRFLIAQVVLPFADSVRCVSLKASYGVMGIVKSFSILPIRQEFNVAPSKQEKEFKGRVLMVCRLEREKNIETALKAFSMICKDFKDAIFTIVGDGSRRKNLEFIAKSLGVEDRVKFAGWSNDTSNFYQNTDIYISTSLYEGYGLSTMEAALSGLPLVLSDAGIAKEFFDGKGAFVCEPDDNKQFYSALNYLFANPELRKRMSLDSKKSAEANLISHQKYLELYKSSIEGAYNSKIKKSFLGRLLVFLISIIESNKIVRFIIAGGSVALSQILFLYILTEFFDLWYLLSSTFSFVYAVIASFILQKYWAFRDKSKEGIVSQFIKFIIVGFIGIFINTVSMYFWVDIVGIWYVVSQFITGFIIAVINFLIYKFFIFNK